VIRTLLALLVVVPLWAGEVVVVLRPLVSVAAERATLGEVAELTGDEALIAVLRDLPVVELPDLRTRRLEPDEIRRAIGLGLGKTLTVSGFSEISRQGQAISAEELVRAAASRITADGDDLTVTTLRAAGSVTVPAGGAEIAIVAEPLDHARVGDLPFRVRIMRGDVEVGRALVTLRVVRHRTVTVAARAIGRGERIGPGDLRSERVVVGRESAAVVAAADLIGREARRDLAEGTPLTSAVVIIPPDVRAGQQVVLMVDSDRFHLTAAGECLNDGRIGESISVRRAADGRTVRGTVVAEGQVRLDR
jgi:flagella basal body P-ring formation protein FlgA